MDNSEVGLPGARWSLFLDNESSKQNAGHLTYGQCVLVLSSDTRTPRDSIWRQHTEHLSRHQLHQGKWTSLWQWCWMIVVAEVDTNFCIRLLVVEFFWQISDTQSSYQSLVYDAEHVVTRQVIVSDHDGSCTLLWHLWISRHNLLMKP